MKPGRQKQAVAVVVLSGLIALTLSYGLVRHRSAIRRLAAHARDLARVPAGPVHGPVLFDASGGVDFLNAGATERSARGPRVWTHGYFGVEAPMDWSAYDQLEVTLDNPSSNAVSITLEVKDTATDGYWTRVNQPAVVGPGLQTLRIPTRLRVGEPGRPGRALDRAHVTSVILSRGDGDSSGTPIEVRSLKFGQRLPPPGHGIFAFDVGPQDMPVLDGFEPLTKDMRYDPKRGFGWESIKPWEPYPQANRNFGPDRLTASNLTLQSGRLRLDVPPGKYKVWMIIDHPGGYWGEFPYYFHRTITAQGLPLIDERDTPEASRRDYFRWQDAEDMESDDLFEKYWTKLLPERTFETRVDHGALELGFENDACPERVPCWGIALSGLVIFPVNDEEQRQEGEHWLAEVRTRRHADFTAQFKLKSHALSELLESLPEGLQLRELPASRELGLAGARELKSKPAHPVGVFRDARGYFAPVVSWKGDIARELRWSLEGVPAGITVDGGWIRFRAMRETYTGSMYSIRERWVTDKQEQEFAKQGLGRLWLRFSAPKDAKPGTYPVTLVVSAGGPGTEKRSDQRLSFELRVYQAQAAPLDFPVGPFRGRIEENWWDDKSSELVSRLDRLELKSLERLRALGLTAFSFSPGIRLRRNGERIEPDTRNVSRLMTVARRMGFQGLVGYDTVFPGEDFCAAPGDHALLKGAAELSALFDQLERISHEENWLPLTLILCDEPTRSATEALLKRLPDPMSPDRRVQWSVTTSLGPSASAEDRALAARIGLPTLQGFSTSELAKLRGPWGYYNDPSRHSVGLGLLKLRETSDLRYRILWAWNAVSANPYFSFDGREEDYAWCMSTASADLRCTVDLDRTIDQGVTDYRIALELKRRLGDTTLGRKLLEEAKSDSVDPDAWRLKAGEALEGP